MSVNELFQKLTEAYQAGDYWTVTITAMEIAVALGKIVRPANVYMSDTPIEGTPDEIIGKLETALTNCGLIESNVAQSAKIDPTAVIAIIGLIFDLIRKLRS